MSAWISPVNVRCFEVQIPAQASPVYLMFFPLAGQTPTLCPVARAQALIRDLFSSEIC